MSTNNISLLIRTGRVGKPLNTANVGVGAEEPDVSSMRPGISTNAGRTALSSLADTADHPFGLGDIGLKLVLGGLLA
ncbi:hypothetical protein [Herbaspirillum camelliae]|uniref:hypothetical protein n=1 Tax=Herbaspirillum camelliae TaxID=1892903 RepID=UPI000949D437|nr:hypothetical protein [Herbaspirillum camelliae]